MSKYPKLSKRKVVCVNASTLGFGKYVVNSGEIIKWRQTYKDGTEGDSYLGRVLGSVAEYWQPGDENLKGWLVVLTLSDCGTFAYVRYVKPEWVRIIHSAERLDFLRWFAGPMGDGTDVMKYADYGSLSSSYIHQHVDGDGRLVPFGDEGRPPAHKGEIA